MTGKRYRMEYVNSEVSAIYDDYEKEEMIAEEIVDRLNELSTKNRQLKEDVERQKKHKKDCIKQANWLNEELDKLKNENEQLTKALNYSKKFILNNNSKIVCAEYLKSLQEVVRND